MPRACKARALPIELYPHFHGTWQKSFWEFLVRELNPGRQGENLVSWPSRLTRIFFGVQKRKSVALSVKNNLDNKGFKNWYGRKSYSRGWWLNNNQTFQGATGIEPATTGSAILCSTTELHTHLCYISYNKFFDNDILPLRQAKYHWIGNWKSLKGNLAWQKVIW